MFYCEECRVEKDWPKSLFIKSEGACEECGKQAVCHETPTAFIQDRALLEAIETLLRKHGNGYILDAIRDDTLTEEMMEEWAKNKGYRRSEGWQKNWTETEFEKE